jgi:hypothetical protein
MDGLEKAMNSLKRRVDESTNRRRRFQDDKRRYTMIWHAVRQQLDLTVAEYVMCDIIHGLSSNRGAVPGWCYASKESLGKNLGITRQGAQKIIDRLLDKGLVEADPETNYLRATEKWIYAVELQKRRVYDQDAA